MTQRAAIVALLIAIATGLATWLAMRTPPAPPAAVAAVAGLLEALDPRNVRSISVVLPGREEIVVEQSEVPELWLLTMPARGGLPARAWPASASHIRGAVRLISDLAASLPQQDPAPPPSDAIAVTFSLTDGQQLRLLLFGSALGGRTVVHVSGGAAGASVGGVDARLADAALARLFTREGLMGWRDPGALGAPAADVARIRLESAGRWVSLRRSLGRWSVEEPIVGPADSQACAQLSERLASIPMRRFLDDASPTDPALGLVSPTALAMTESDVRIARGGDVVRRTLIQELRLGGPADAAQATLFASAVAYWQDPESSEKSIAWGPAVGVIDRKDVDPIAARGEAYLSVRAVALPVADIGKVTISPTDQVAEPAGEIAKPSLRALAFVRTVEGWRSPSASGSSRVPPDTTRVHLESLISTLCDQPADVVSIEKPATVEPIARVELGGVDTPPAAAVWLAVTKVKGQRAMLVQTGPVFRTYIGPQALAVLQWLRDELPPEG